VCLLTFEGDESAVLQFASLSQASLASLIAGRGYAGPPGHVQVITAEEIRAVPSAPSEAVVEEQLQAALSLTLPGRTAPVPDPAAEGSPRPRRSPRLSPPPPSQLRKSPSRPRFRTSPSRRLRPPPAGGACIIRRRNRSSAR
jgi:hypothetical protein